MALQIASGRIYSDTSALQLQVFYFPSIVDSGIPELTHLVRQECSFTGERVQKEVEKVVQRQMLECITLSQRSKARRVDKTGSR